MTDITTFKCTACDGNGGSGPIRKSTGLPFRPCIYCSGVGEIEREVEDLFDKMGRMSALALLCQDGGSPDARTLKIKTEIEGARHRDEWDAINKALSKA